MSRLCVILSPWFDGTMVGDVIVGAVLKSSKSLSSGKSVTLPDAEDTGAAAEEMPDAGIRWPDDAAGTFDCGYVERCAAFAEYISAELTAESTPRRGSEDAER